MKNIFALTGSLLFLLSGCTGEEKAGSLLKNTAPQVLEQGQKIVFPDTTGLAFFATETIASSALQAEITAPAKVAATVLASGQGAAHPIVLFENPELASSYTALLQNQVNIRQKQAIIRQKKAIIQKKKSEVVRYKDLAEHGVGTGKDLADAQVDLLSTETDLSLVQNELDNERTAIIESESQLKAGGFNPATLRKASAGMAYLIGHVPENQLSKFKAGSICTILFPAFPGEKFTGKIEEVADMTDVSTRMVKLRIRVDNISRKFKAGMFASVRFNIRGGDHLSIDQNSLVTVQGNNYVFVKIGSNTFLRQQIATGAQVGQRIIVLQGLESQAAVVKKGVMQLKGLSFGY